MASQTEDPPWITIHPESPNKTKEPACTIGLVVCPECHPESQGCVLVPQTIDTVVKGTSKWAVMFGEDCDYHRLLQAAHKVVKEAEATRQSAVAYIKGLQFAEDVLNDYGIHLKVIRPEGPCKPRLLNPPPSN